VPAGAVKGRILFKETARGLDLDSVAALFLMCLVLYLLSFTSLYIAYDYIIGVANNELATTVAGFPLDQTPPAILSPA